MQFYDATKTSSAICQEIDRICDSTDTSFTRLDKTAEANNALEEIVGDLINEDGVYQFDDTNYTDLPRGKGTLIEGQEWYSFASEYLKIEEISILPLNGQGMYRKLKQIDNVDLHGTSWEEYFGHDSSGNPNKGLTRYYDILGDSIRLGLAPTSTAVTLTNGLQITFKRTASLFAYTGTIAVPSTAIDTTVPGIPSPYHPLICYKASLLYCAKYKPERVAFVESEIAKFDKKLKDHMSKRNPDRRGVMKGKKIKFI